MDEFLEILFVKDVLVGSLCIVFNEFKRLIQSIVDGMEFMSFWRFDDDFLEEQIRQISEDLRVLREFMEGERGKLR